MPADRRLTPAHTYMRTRNTYLSVRAAYAKSFVILPTASKGAEVDHIRVANTTIFL